MLAGQPPYRGETAVSVAIQHLQTKPVALTTVRPELSPDAIRLVEKLMEKDPKDRFQSAGELLRELQRLRGKSTLPVELAATGPLPAVSLEPAPIATSEPSKMSLTITIGMPLVGSLLATPKRRTAVLLLGLAAALSAGALVGWLRRPMTIAQTAAHNGEGVSAPDVADIPRSSRGDIQRAYAVLAQSPAEREARLWAVLEHWQGDEAESIEAAEELVHTYIDRRDYDRAILAADKLITCPDPKQKMIGCLLRGIALSRRGDAGESNESFHEMLNHSGSGRPDVEPPDPQWLAAEYSLALDRNADKLGIKRPDELMQKFLEQVLGRPLGRRRA
jgi:serine/threonine-protein kinase